MGGFAGIMSVIPLKALVVKAVLMLALGLSGQSSVVELIREALEGAETHIERVAAAMAMIPFFGHLVQDEAILTLIDALAEPDELRLVYEELPWADDDLVVDLGALLASFNDGGRCPVLAPLYERLAGCETRSGVMSLLEAAMIIAFEPHEHEGPEFEIEALSGPQRDLLARVEKEDRLWSSAIRVGELLGDYGLPADRAALRSLLRES